MAGKLVSSFSHDPSAVEFTVSMKDYLSARSDATYKYIATGALVLDTTVASTPQILLLQRAAHDSNPNKWEPPGGACDDEDESILHGVARELWEETGLAADRISGPIGEPHLFTSSRGKEICRLSFLVFVKKNSDTQPEVKLDPNEHQNFVWAAEDEVKAGQAGDIALNFTRDNVKVTVLQAFEQLKQDGK